ncbi:ribonuclease H-like domain-containing protein, partial [Tanacetum coccineum]
GIDTAYLLLYVDNIALTASFETLLWQIISLLHQEISRTDLGSLNYYLGISVMRDSIGMFLSQRKYAVEILERAHMINCNSSRTLVDTESKLRDDGDPVSDLTLYQSLAGSLQDLTFTRLDISYAVHQEMDIQEKDKNRSQIDKTEHENRKSVKEKSSQSQKSTKFKVKSSREVDVERASKAEPENLNCQKWAHPYPLSGPEKAHLYP